MAVKLRLRRMGRKKLPIYALVAADARSPRDGRYIEDLGRYEPLSEPATVRLKEDRILYWLGEGAQPSHTVRNLLSGQGVMLRLHLLRKGKTEEEIEQAVTAFLAHRAENRPVKKSKAELRAERLEKERAVAAEKAAEMAKKRAEREAELEKQRQEDEDAQRAERAAADADVTAEAPAEGGDEATVEEEAGIEEVAEEAASEATAEDVVEEAPEGEAEVVEEPVAEEAPEEEAEVVEEPEAEEAPEEEAEVAEEREAEEAPEEESEVVEDPEAEEAPAEEPVAAETTAEPDKLTKILGIGPKFSALLNEHDITTFAQLTSLELESLRTIVDESGLSTATANEESWAQQAAFLAADDKDGLKAFIVELKKG